MTVTPQQQKAVRKWITYIGNYILVLCILVGCIQPQYFKVDYQKDSRNPYPVYASFNQEQVYAGIRLDNLIVGEDGSTKVKYNIKEGDTIQSIAKQFGTTKQSILDSNGISDPTSIKVGQNIVISYDNGVIINVKETSTLKEFSKKHGLNLQDLVSMNYFDSSDINLEEDQEIFVNLNQEEAESKGLLEKKAYESPYERFRLEDEEQAKLDAIDGQTHTEDSNNEGEEPQQEVISAEETAEQIAQANNKDIPEEKPDPIQDDVNKVEIDTSNPSCDTNMCLFDGKCVKRPENAYCTKNDQIHVRKCKQGYSEQGKECIKVKNIAPKKEEKKEEKKKEEKKPKKKSSKAVSQGYFNPHADGAPTDGRGPGQCTSFAHWYRWKYYGIRSMGFRGNAKVWARNAARAGRKVNKTPAIGSIGVTVGGGGGYGHVFVIIAIDGNSVQIQEMNYAGRYIVTKRWMSISSINAFIHPVKN